MDKKAFRDSLLQDRAMVKTDSFRSQYEFEAHLNSVYGRSDHAIQEMVVPSNKSTNIGLNRLISKAYVRRLHKALEYLVRKHCKADDAGHLLLERSRNWVGDKQNG